MDGATFCQASTMKAFSHERPSTTWGSHMWNGAAAIFIKRLKKIKKVAADRLEKFCWKVVANKLIIKRIEDAKAWIKKYFSVASFSRGQEEFINNAKIASMLISRPIHAISHEEAETEKIGPRMRSLRNRAFQGRTNIQKGNYSIFGIWAQELF